MIASAAYHETDSRYFSIPHSILFVRPFKEMVRASTLAIFAISVQLPLKFLEDIGRNQETLSPA